MVIDLDPGEPAGILDCARVALELRDMLDHFDLQCVVKTSGGKGLHLSVPLNTAAATSEESKQFALALGQVLEGRDPKRVTVDMAKPRRVGRVFVDWSQNDGFKTTVCAYSLRIGNRPTVSTPVTWDELVDAIDAGDPGALTFETDDVLARVEAVGDHYADTLTVRQHLPAL
jgi:bifunctional non-homologous end joining protein LigD